MTSIDVDDLLLIGLQLVARSADESPNDVVWRLLRHYNETEKNPSADLEPQSAPPLRPASGNEPLGGLTPQATYRPLIIESLISHGGEAHLSVVLRDIANRMAGRLTEADRECVSDGEERWYNYARWERNELAKDGLIDRMAPRGLWRLTQRGRESGC